MTDKEKIEAELERLKYAFNQDADIASAEDAVGEKIAQAKYELCCTLLDFSNSLPEEPASEVLEEEYNRFLKEERFNMPGKTVLEMMFLTAKHFAQWGKEQMMNDAKSGIGNYDNYIKFEDETWIDLEPSMQRKPAFNVNEGDKVKVIVIKED